MKNHETNSSTLISTVVQKKHKNRKIVLQRKTPRTFSGLYLASTPSPWNSCRTSFSFLVESKKENVENTSLQGHQSGNLCLFSHGRSSTHTGAWIRNVDSSWRNVERHRFPVYLTNSVYIKLYAVLLRSWLLKFPATKTQAPKSISF